MTAAERLKVLAARAVQLTRDIEIHTGEVWPAGMVVQVLGALESDGDDWDGGCVLVRGRSNRDGMTDDFRLADGEWKLPSAEVSHQWGKAL